MKSANKGKELLKRKADALKVQFRIILKALIDVFYITNNPLINRKKKI